jgi:hypothetical protein
VVAVAAVGWLIPIATANSPATQLHASGVNGVLVENREAVSLTAVSESRP